VLRQGRSPQLKNKRYNSVLPGQGYRTAQEEYEVMAKFWLAGKNQSNLERNLPLYRFAQHLP
jgi:hypothetical protein